MPRSPRPSTDTAPTRAAGRPPRTYSTALVARRLGISIPTVQRWVDAGRLKAWKTPGGHRRIDAASADRLFETQATTAALDDDAPSVVIVEDNAAAGAELRRLVDEALPGAQVRLFDSGIQALVAIGREAPEVLIAQLAMPHVDGAEVLRQLSTRCEVQPRLVVAVSRIGEAGTDALGELPPQVHHVVGPVDPAAFIALLRGLR